MIKVLLLEDDEDYKKLIHRVLRDLNRNHVVSPEEPCYMVDHAETNEEALRLLDLDSYDLFIVDYAVPPYGTSEPFLAALVSESPAPPPVLFLSERSIDQFSASFREVLDKTIYRYLDKSSALDRNTLHQAINELQGRGQGSSEREAAE